MTNLVQTAALLLERVPAIVQQCKDQYRKTGTAYNIFIAAGISEKEVIMCRVLADLLNPKGLHYRESVYLKLFMDMVVKPLIENASTFNPAKAKITTEYTINEDRRIDIVLDDGTVFIPIEVKINASEQEQQLADYAAVSRKMNAGPGFIPVLFLTPDGHTSIEAPKDDYVPISFDKHIIPWLAQCLNLEETDKAAPIREILKQLIKAIKLFCGNMEDGTMENAIKGLITESSDNYAAALMIYKAVNELNFDQKAWEIFKEQIFSLVKDRLPDTQYVETGEGDDAWYCFDIPLGNGCNFCVNYDMQSFAVEAVNTKAPVTAEMADKINRKMSGITGVRNEADDWGGNFVWCSGSVHYPGLEKIDDDAVYKYELYRVYAKEPGAAADRIVSIVTDLKNI